MEKSKTRKIQSLVFLCAFTYFISYLTRKNFSTIILAMSSGMNIAQDSLSIALTVNFIAYGLGQLISGFFGDKIQPKKLVALGLIVTVLMNIVMPFCRNVAIIAICWCINGFAQAFMWPPIVKLMTSNFTDEEYKKHSQKVSWASSIATVFLYLICPLIIHLLNWQAVFIFSAIGGLVGLVYWWTTCPEVELKPKENKNESGENKKRSSFGLILIPVMIAIVLQGVLRDGVTDWMPSYTNAVFNLSEEISILSGVVLPLFSMFSFAITTWLYTKKIQNPMTCSAVVFGVGAVASVLLWIFPSGSPVLSIALSAVLTACMHGVNLLLICMVPAYFKRMGNVSMISGVLNCCTYVGSAVSAYVIPLIASGAGGWTLNLLIWAIIAVLGTVICFITVPSWNRFQKRLDRDYPLN